MRFIYYYAGSVNGEDALGHYIRSLVTLTATSQRVPPSLASASQSALFACVTGTNACPTSATTFKPAPATSTAYAASTPRAASTPSAARSAQAPAAKALLSYLLAP